MKLGQIIAFKMTSIFVKNYAENVSWGLDPVPFSFIGN